MRCPASTPATQALTKIAATTTSPARRSATRERSANAMPSGTGVSASPKLWIRSASRATLPLAVNTAAWAIAATASTASESDTAWIPSRERQMLSCTRPWEWPCPASCRFRWSCEWRYASGTGSDRRSASARCRCRPS